MRKDLLELTDTYRQAGDAILAAIAKDVDEAGGFVNASNNKQEKPDMKAVVFDSGKGYSETFPIRALRLNEKGAVEVYIGTFGTVYTDSYLRGRWSAEHWMSLKDSNVLFYQTILSIARSIDEYLPAKEG